MGGSCSKSAGDHLSRLPLLLEREDLEYPVHIEEKADIVETNDLFLLIYGLHLLMSK